MKDIYKENAKIYKAFCDEKRLRLLELLQTGEKCACILLKSVEMGQSTLSHHMKILVESGIVCARRDGKWTYYSISDDGVQYAKDLLIKITKKNITNCREDCPAITKL